MRLSRKLTALGAFFVLALVVAGCGSGVPGGSVASVAGNPITTRAFDHWMYVAAKGNAASSPGSPVITPNDPPSFKTCITQARAQIPSLAKTPVKTLRTECGTLFTSLNSTVMDFLIKAYWYQLLAHKLHVTLTPRELQTAFVQAEQQSRLTTPTAVSTFLKETGQTLTDIRYRVRVNELYKDLVNKEAKKVTPAVIAAYYNSHQSAFGSAETRDIRVVRTNAKSAAQAALKALQSKQSWKSVAKKYSVDTTSKGNGGLLTGISKGEEEHALDSVTFSSPLNKLEGPVHGTFGWYVVEVVKITPATHESLAKATTAIKQLLTQQSQSAAANHINALAKKYWGKQTLCLSAYSMNDCHGYKPPKTSTTGSSGTGGSGSASGGSGSSGGTTGTTSTGTATSGSTSKKKK